jgi:hypothetical protein
MLSTYNTYLASHYFLLFVEPDSLLSIASLSTTKTISPTAMDLAVKVKSGKS